MMISRPKKSMNRGGMRLLLAVAMVVLTAQSLAAMNIAGASASSVVEPRYAASQVLITLKPGFTQADLAGFNTEYRSSVVRKLSYGNTYLVNLPGTGTPSESVVRNAANIRMKYPAIQAVQFNHVFRPMVVQAPNDEYFESYYDVTRRLRGQWQFQPDPETSSLKHIYALEGWELQKGSSDVIVAVIDTGIRTSTIPDPNTGDPVREPHPDLVNRLILDAGPIVVNDASGMWGVYPDSGMRDNDPSPPETLLPTAWMHGTMCAGIIGAEGNNGIGITGVCWEGVRILPVKACRDTDGRFYEDGLYDALEYVIRYRDSRVSSRTGEPLRVNVVNMSLGGQEPWSSLLASQIRRAVDSGIVVVAAAGNDWEYGAFPPAYPAALEEVICVGSTNSRDIVSSYSQRGRTLDIVAPGEDIMSTAWGQVAGPDDGGDGDGGDGGEDPPPWTPGSLYSTSGPLALSTTPDRAGNYIAEFESGTSFAAPVISGVAALLISHGVPASDVKQILYSTATPIGFGRPNDTYGWGLVNMRKALEKASVDVQIQTPAKSSIVSNARPRFRIDFRHALKSTIQVWLDKGTANEVLVLGGAGARIANWDSLYYTLNASAGKTYLLFDYPVSPGTHTVTVTADSDMQLQTTVTATDTAKFIVRTSELVPGWHMFSVPYALSSSVTPDAIIGSAAQLWRYAYADGDAGTYAAYSTSGRADNEATFHPNSVAGTLLVHPIDETIDTSPAGLGYWLRVGATGLELPGLDTSIATEVGTSPYQIGLYTGWNMVGCPYPSPASWGSALFDFGGLRLTATEAYLQGWITNLVYSYDAIRQVYVTSPVSSAVMKPWEAQWIRVKAVVPQTTRVFNPSFEGGFSSVSAPNAGYVGDNWSAFNSSGNGYFSVGTQGVSDGSSQMIAPYGANPGWFSCGVYQLADAQPGQRYTFSVWTKRQRNCSGVLGTCRWPGQGPNAEGTQVGIDPTGGTDPMSANVCWSPVETLVGEWTQQSAYAQAQQSQISVFVRVVANDPGTDRSVYIDSAKIMGGPDVTLIVNP